MKQIILFSILIIGFNAQAGREVEADSWTLANAITANASPITVRNAVAKLHMDGVAIPRSILSANPEEQKKAFSVVAAGDNTQGIMVRSASGLILQIGPTLVTPTAAIKPTGLILPSGAGQIVAPTGDQINIVNGSRR